MGTSLTTTDQALAAYRLASPGERSKLEEEVYKVLSRHAYAIIFKTLRDRRPDIANYAIHQALAGVDRFRGEARFSTWFTSIVKRLCLMDVRKRVGEGQEVPLEEARKAQVRLEPRGVGFDLTSLDPEERRIVELILEGNSDGEIGKILGLHRNTVLTRKREIGRKLRG